MVASRNFEQGVDLNENDAGDLRITMADVKAAGNLQEGIEFEGSTMSRAAGGDLTARVLDVTVRRNGGAGVALEQESPGAGAVTFRNLTATGNAEGAVVAEGVDVTGAQ